MTDEHPVATPLGEVRAVLARAEAAARMTDPILGVIGAENEPIVRELLESEWAKKWLKDVTIAIEPHGSTPSLRTVRFVRNVERLKRRRPKG